MKNNSIKLLMLFTLISVFAACKKDNNMPNAPETTEYKYVRLLLSDASTNQITLLNPISGEVNIFDAKNPKAALYTTASQRFATLVERDFNFVEVFDSGFESHGEHIDVKGTPKFGALTGTPIKPTHFKSKGDEILTFNDGDGTLSIAKEGNFHVVGSQMQTINTGLTAHHGAMTKFDNGSYAITVKDGSLAGGLPERVKIINANGSELFASTIQTKGIHGNASNGKVALFGTASGVLVVKPTGEQELIKYPDNFGTAWFGSILEAEAVDKFVGYTAAMGAFSININTKTITPIIASTDILQCKIDYAGKNLVVLLYDGSLKIFNLDNGSLKNEGKIATSTDKNETVKPFLEATERFIYVALPKSGEVLQVNTSDFGKTQKFKVSATPFSMALMGFENSESH